LLLNLDTNLIGYDYSYNDLSRFIYATGSSHFFSYILVNKLYFLGGMRVEGVEGNGDGDGDGDGDG